MLVVNLAVKSKNITSAHIRRGMSNGYFMFFCGIIFRNVDDAV